jgi:hypothetical protein
MRFTTDGGQKLTISTATAARSAARVALSYAIRAS